MCRVFDTSVETCLRTQSKFTSNFRSLVRKERAMAYHYYLSSYMYITHVGSSEDYLVTLAKNLLSLESPTRGKFILLSSLSHYLPTDKFLQASPQLPVELLSVMGHQALACHVRNLLQSYNYR